MYVLFVAWQDAMTCNSGTILIYKHIQTIANKGFNSLVAIKMALKGLGGGVVTIQV